MYTSTLTPTVPHTLTSFVSWFTKEANARGFSPPVSIKTMLKALGPISDDAALDLLESAQQFLLKPVRAWVVVVMTMIVVIMTPMKVW